MLAVLRWCHAGFLLEHTVQVLRVLETYLIADVGDRPVGVGKEFLCSVNDVLMDIVCGRLPRLLLDKVSEIVWRKAELRAQYVASL